MKRIKFAVLLCAFLYPNHHLSAQEKAKTEDRADVKRDITPLRVQVVISEYDGEKKISSLPYTLLVNAEARGGKQSSIRMGLRVPIATSTNAFQYQDLGTNLDSWASKTEEGRFVLHLAVERSSVYPSSAVNTSAALAGSEPRSSQPVIQQFRTELELLLRDGQTIQSTVATDPVSGRVSRVDVTLAIIK